MRRSNAVSDELYVAAYNTKNRTVSDDHLSDIFATVGRKYGYDDVTAEFAPLRDLKVQWTRSYRRAEFRVTDYLDRAPDDALVNLADVLFTKISGGDADYGESFIRYVNDPKVIRDNRDDYLKRSRNLGDSSVGDYHDLNDCVNRLRDQGLIPNDLECVLVWDSAPNPYRVSGCSLLNRVASVNKVLDAKGVPEHVLDCAVYNSLCAFIVGFPPGPDFEERQRSLAHRYPMYMEANRWLRDHGMSL